MPPTPINSLTASGSCTALEVGLDDTVGTATAAAFCITLVDRFGTLTTDLERATLLNRRTRLDNKKQIRITCE